MKVTGWGSENPMKTILSPWQQTLCVGTRGSWQDSPCSATPGELWCCLLPGLDHQECQAAAAAASTLVSNGLCPGL